MNDIRLLVPLMPSTEAVQPYLQQIDARRWYTNFGPLSQSLETRIAETFRFNADVCTVGNCTVGLELALMALELPEGTPVVLPTFTFVATATAVLRAGLRPVFADVDPRTWLLTPEIAKAACKETGATVVMPVATFGVRQDTELWDALSQQEGLTILVDAAGAFGNQEIGNHTTTVFSLHATKSFSSGEGGIVVSRNTRLVDKVRRLSNFGIDLRSGVVDCPGTNGKLSEYHAAVGLASLDMWEEQKSLRSSLLKWYLDSVSGHGLNERLQLRREGTYTIFTVRTDTRSQADRLMQRLSEEGIETRRWYFPMLHEHPAFKDFRTVGSLSNARRLSGCVVGLPFHPFLSRDDVARVVAAVAAALAAVPR